MAQQTAKLKYSPVIPHRMTKALRSPKGRDALARICAPPDTAQPGDIIGVVQTAIFKKGSLAITPMPIDQFIVIGRAGAVGMVGWSGLDTETRRRIAVDVLDLQSAGLFTQILQEQVKPLIGSEDENQNFSFIMTPTSILAIEPYTFNRYILPKAKSSEEEVSTCDIEMGMLMLCDSKAVSGHEKLARARALTLDGEVFSTLYRVMDEDHKIFRLGTPDFFTPTEEKV
jgi:hypothetical protein